MDISVRYTPYLVTLVADASTAAGRLLDLPRDAVDDLAEWSRRDASRASARLDASPLPDSTVAEIDGGRWRPPAGVAQQRGSGGWAQALRLDSMATEEVAAVEYYNLLAAHAQEPELAPGFFDDPLATLATLHATICRGLVDPEVVGRPRTTAQAVHDGAQGKVVFNTPDPRAVPGLLRDLQAWLRGEDREGSAAFPAPVAAAIVHELVLQWQPYEAANGRMARAAARMVLRARGMDPHGLAVPERTWAADPGGYYAEVAATIRRRAELGPWIERHTEALVDAFVAVSAHVHGPPARPGPRAFAAAAALRPGQTLTVADYAKNAGISRETAWRDLRLLVVCGELVREPKSLGRRFRRP